MNQDEIIYITGHQHPDTDAIVAAISYAHLKNKLGVKAIACRLGDLNPETSYLLKRFGFEQPYLLEDARKTLGEITLDDAAFISPETTIRETMRLMQEKNQPYFGVCDRDGRLLGMVTKSDLVKVGLGDTSIGISLLKATSIHDIAKTIEGKIVYDDPNYTLNGKVSIIAITRTKLENYEIKERIVITGDDPEAQKELIKKGAGALIVVWSKKVEDDVLSVARKYHCPIILSGHGSMNTSRYIYFAPPVSLVMNTKVVSFQRDELVEDAAKKMMNHRFRGFPVVDEENHLVGYVGRYHVMNYQNKKIIMVDHNEFSQSVKAIEKAQILEVVDHHRINDFSTTQPIRFRTEIIGSSASIIYKLYREQGISIPQNIASILLGAVLSDTLMFQSPTTTPEDIEIANQLAAIAGLEIQSFGREMFAASANIEGKSILELIDRDVKPFNIHGVKTMISQIIIPEADMLSRRPEEVQAALDQFCQERGLDLAILAITGIIDKGSVFFAAGDKAAWMADAFPDNENEKHSLQAGVLSRKKQFVPLVTSAIVKNL